MSERPDAIGFSLAQTQQPNVEAWTRPYVMEALIRGGAEARDVFARFSATANEQGRVDDLLASPSVWGR